MIDGISYKKKNARKERLDRVIPHYYEIYVSFVDIRGGKKENIMFNNVIFIDSAFRDHI
jgi:hypothetical protein